MQVIYHDKDKLIQFIPPEFLEMCWQIPLNPISLRMLARSARAGGEGFCRFTAVDMVTNSLKES